MKSGRVLSSGIIPFRRENGQTLVLLLRAFKYWDFPKGRVEAGEEPLEAAIRELAEETALTKVNFPLGEIFYETEPYAQNKVARFYIGEVNDSDVKLLINEALGRAEHHEFRWVSLATAKSLLGPRLKKALLWAEQEMVREGLLTKECL